MVLPPIRTYKTDAETAIQRGNLSQADLAIAESKKRLAEGGVETFAPKEPRNRFRTALLVTTAVALILGSVSLVGYALYSGNWMRGATEKAPITTESIIFSEQTIELHLPSTLSGRDVAVKVSDIIQTFNGKLSTVGNIIPRHDGTVALTAQELLVRLAERIPRNFVRALEEDYMLGVYSFKENQGFLVLTTLDYEQAFAGLLEWEPAMPESLIRTLAERSLPKNLTEYLWKDTRIKNIDARTFQNKEGEVLLISAFINRSTLIVAPSIDTFLEIYTRYTTPKPVKR